MRPTELHIVELDLGDRSLDDFRSALQAAIADASDLPGTKDSRWVRDVFDDWFALDVDGGAEIYRVDYEQDEDGEFSFDLGDKVKRGYIAAEAASASDVFTEQTIDQKKSMGKAMFAYTPDANPSTWKLPMGPPGSTKKTRKFLGQAVAAAFAPGGFRGQKAKIPIAAKAGVKSKLRAGYRSLGVEKEDWPSSLREGVAEAISDLEESTILESFPTVFEILERDDQGRALRVKGSSGVVGVENKNGRTYPRELIEDDLPRLADQAAAGKFVGEIDHPGDGTARLRHTGLKFEEFTLTDSGQLEYIASVVPTDAGQDFAALVESGVAVEMSWRGRGRTKREEFNGEETSLVQPGYKLLGIDAVVEGSAPGTSAQITEGTMPPDKDNKDKDGKVAEAAAAEKAKADAEKAKAEEAKKAAGTSTDKPVVENKDSPTIKIEAATEGDVKRIVEQTVEAERARMWPVLRDARVGKAVGKLVEEKPALKTFAPAMAASLLKVEKESDFDARFQIIEQAYTEMVGGLDHAKLSSIGVVQGEQRLAESYMNLPDGKGGWKVVARPNTIGGVKTALLDGLDNGGGLAVPKELEEAMAAGTVDRSQLMGCSTFDNPAWILGRILENYERGTPSQRRLLTSMTTEGFKLHKQLMEVTDASDFVAGTPYVLPILRDIFPVILDVGLWSTQPMDRPAGKAFWLHLLTDPGGVNLAKTPQSGIAVYEESEYPNEIQLQIDDADVAAISRALRWQWKVTTEQDIAAYFGLSVQGELLTVARNAILREIFWHMIQQLMTGATGGNQNFGVQMPAAGYTSQDQWDAQLFRHADYLASQIASASLRKPNIMLVGAQETWRFHPQTPQTGWAANPNPGNWDFGVVLLGTLNNWFRVFAVDWWDSFYQRQFLLGYNGSSWLDNAAIYLPYIPWYLTSVIESTNMTKDQAGMSRFASYVSRPELFGTITLQNIQGTAITW